MKEFNVRDLIQNAPVAYGSPFVPTREELKTYMQPLTDAIVRQPWKRIIMRHNLHICLCFLATQFNFAHRPRNSMEYPFDLFCAGNDEAVKYEIINDKLSKIYREERILPVSRPLSVMTQNVREGFPEVKKYIHRKLNSSLLRYVPETFFFFIDKTGKPVPFSLERFLACLEEASLKYPYDLRMPRHYVRTYFFKKRVSHDLANLWLGHHHVAKEALGISSTVLYRDVVKIGLPIVEEMMKEIGLEPVRYLADGNGLP